MGITTKIKSKKICLKRGGRRERSCSRDRVLRFTTGPEHRVRSIYWDISEHNVDREVEGIVYEIARDAATKAIHKAIAKRQKEREDERLKHQVAL